MRLIRLLLVICLLGLGLGLAWLVTYGRRSHATTAVEVPRGDAEIAWIASATGGTEWERFVAALHSAKAKRLQGPAMILDDSRAYPERSFEIPEVRLSFTGCTGTLWFRWYKVTSEMNIERWTQEFSKRNPPPLAVIGGASSSEALDLAKALAQDGRPWTGPKPLLLITQATADRIWDRGVEGPELMQLYPGRTFRFCFRNSQMATAVLDFVWSRPELVPSGDPPTVHRLEWQDNPYSLDLSNQFVLALQRMRTPHALKAVNVRYSVGDFHRPNPSEAVAIKNLAAELTSTEERSLLVLPIGSQPARRLLHALTTSAPRTRNLVAVSGDSIGLNTVRRDRDVAWNVQDVPVPLVIFCHQHPADPTITYDAAATYERRNATDILVLHLSLVDKLVKAAYGWNDPKPGLVGNADELRDNLLQQQGDFFDEQGNRRSGTGEHVIYLRPHVRESQVQPAATLEVWVKEAAAGEPTPTWRLRLSERLEYGNGVEEQGTNGNR